MGESPKPTEGPNGGRNPRDAGFWAVGRNVLRVSDVPAGALARASDPVYEAGFRLIGATAQERIWTHVLTTLAARFGVRERVHLEKVCVDPKLQWFRAGNVWHNAGLRSCTRWSPGSVRRAG
jgi:hypothetical protein